MHRAPSTHGGTLFRLISWLASTGFALTGAAWAGVRTVPFPYPTVQAGLNAAQTGDTVVVAPGTYVENLLWPDRAGISLRSEQGASVTFLDGGRNETVLGLYHASIDTTTRIQGFTITGGKVGGS